MRFDILQRRFLVYEGGGDAPPQTSTTNTTQMYSPEEAARRAALMAEAQRVYESAKSQVGSAAPVGPSADTLQAQSMYRQMASNNPIAGMGQELQNAQTQGFNAMLNPTASPGFQSTLDTALRRVGQTYTDPGGVLSQIRGGFTAGNSGGSGTREGIAGGIAGREYLNTVGDVTGRLTSDAYNKGMDVFSRTMALAPQNMQAIMAGQSLPANIMSTIGQQNEGYAEQQRQWNLQSPWAALTPYAGIVQGMSNPSTQTTSTTPGAQNNPMAPIGAAMLGASLFPSMPFVGAGAGLALSLFN